MGFLTLIRDFKLPRKELVKTAGLKLMGHTLKCLAKKKKKKELHNNNKWGVGGGGGGGWVIIGTLNEQTSRIYPQTLEQNRQRQDTAMHSLADPAGTCSRPGKVL